MKQTSELEEIGFVWAKQCFSLNRKLYDKVRKAFYTQRSDAAKRNIEFSFLFYEWVGWWFTNLGPDWAILRGHKKGQFVMARHKDRGPYLCENVKCITSGANLSEGHLGKAKSEIHKQRIGRANRGYRKTEEEKEYLRKLRLGKKLSAATKRKIGAASKGSLNPSAKITESEVLEVKHLILLGFKNPEIVTALEGKVRYATVSSIRHGHSWAHVHVQNQRN